MGKVTPASKRKSEHIQINLEQDVDSGLTTGLQRYHFIHEALPELDLEQIRTSTELFGRSLAAPLLISSMTGGTDEAQHINRNLAEAAQSAQIAMGVGSQRVAIETPETAQSFTIRDLAPDILLFANLGAIQLNYGYDLDACRRAVEMIEADALILHFNAIQEAVQPEGDTQFSGLLAKIEQVCEKLTVPVIAKEVGWGFSVETAGKLIDAGIAAIDVAGAGGTSWSQVEMHRARTPEQAALAAAFLDWGIPTATAIETIHSHYPEFTLIASGGLRNGVDIAKCIGLGARLAGMAGPFLKAAVESSDAVLAVISHLVQTLRVTMFATGSATLNDLTKSLTKLEK
jgi:isopentenyl-diphosphate delta-isomerase